MNSLNPVRYWGGVGVRQAVANSWVIISNIICACVSCCCKNLISNSTRPIQFKNSCQKGEIAFPSSRNPKFPRGSMPPDSPWCFVASPLNVHSPKHSPLATPLPVPCIWLIFITDPSGNYVRTMRKRGWGANHYLIHTKPVTSLPHSM